MEFITIDTPSHLQYRKIIELLRATWPPKDTSISIEEGIERLRNLNKGSFEKNIMLFEGEELFGYARIFGRRIKIGKRIVNNMALASVCVQNTYRKNGYGRIIVNKAFEFVRDDTFECSVFQTRVPGFYVKLGAKQISNKVINSKNNGENPFWDPNIILYPKDYEIGEDIIDLLGNGY